MQKNLFINTNQGSLNQKTVHNYWIGTVLEGRLYFYAEKCVFFDNNCICELL